MFGLIKSIVKLGILVSSYTIIIPYLLEWGPAFAEFFIINGLPPVVLSVITCTVATLNWIFSPTIVNIAIVIWLLIPPIKLTIYFMHKVATI